MKQYFVMVAVGIAALLIGWLLLRNTDEQRIREVFDQVAITIRKKGTESPFDQLAKAKSLARHVAPRLTIEGFGNSHTFSVDAADLTQRIVLMRREAQLLRVVFDQLTVTVTGDGTAQVFCNVTGSGFRGWDTANDAYALTATLAKNDSGDWQFVVLHFAPLIPR